MAHFSHHGDFFDGSLDRRAVLVVSFSTKEVVWMFSPEQFEAASDVALRYYREICGTPFRERLFVDINRYLRRSYGHKKSLRPSPSGYEALAEIILGSIRQPNALYDFILIRWFFWELAVLQNIVCHIGRMNDEKLVRPLIDLLEEVDRLIDDQAIGLKRRWRTRKRADFDDLYRVLSPSSYCSLLDFVRLNAALKFLRRFCCPRRATRRLMRRFIECHSAIMSDFSWRMENFNAKRQFDEDPLGYLRSLKAVP